MNASYFIVGAPKCGTTSLAHYLGSHPNIFITDPKEPNYFARSLTITGSYLSQQAWHTDWNSYLRLYDCVGNECRVAGEASTRYLRSRESLLEIRLRFPNAKLIACVRNPVDLAESWHAQKVLEGQEMELDFEKAWRCSINDTHKQRGAGTLAAVDALEYRKIASIGSQLTQLYDLFPRKQVKIVFQDHLSSNTRDAYLDVLEFLCVSDDGRMTFPRLNQRDERKRGVLRDTIQSIIFRSISLVSLGSKELISSNPHQITGASPEFRCELTHFFKDEIFQIETLTKRPASEWCNL